MVLRRIEEGTGKGARAAAASNCFKILEAGLQQAVNYHHWHLKINTLFVRHVA